MKLCMRRSLRIYLRVPSAKPIGRKVLDVPLEKLARTKRKARSAKGRSLDNVGNKWIFIPELRSIAETRRQRTSVGNLENSSIISRVVAFAGEC